MKPQISRRDFLKASGGATGLFVTAGLFRGPLDFLAKSSIKGVTARWGQETTTVCPYASCGCGLICFTDGNELVRVEGDPDHPINRGSVCPKGAGLAQIHNNDRRLDKVLYRAPGGTEWQEKSWDFALDKIANRIAQTRDANWVANGRNGSIVNRTEAIASVGGAALNNEECYLLVKMLRALGLVYIENEARIGHASSIAALTETIGRGGMTNHWTDIRNTDCVMAIGANPAENHPSSFIHVGIARERGAKLISVDPRFTRTSAQADIYSQIRSGTDVAFIGGLIKYVIDSIEADSANYNMAYITDYTNAAFLINPNFKGPVDLDGVFSGYNDAARKYSKSSWSYQTDSAGIPIKDTTLKNPDCVFQLLKKHFARYTTPMVSNTTGSPVATLEEIYQTYSATGAPGKSGTIMYAMGTAQHSNGTQMIRSYAILQLLLGNIGVAGGGLNTLRAEANAQGSTDHCLLFDVLPGYLQAPVSSDRTLNVHLERVTPESNDTRSANWWSNYPKYIISLLKAWWGDAATAGNEFAYHNLPKADAGKDYSWISIFEAMYANNIVGFMDWGLNPAVGGSNINMTYQAMEKLDWLVVTDLWETETAAFWKRPGANPTSIPTEVFLLPAAASYEKEGSVTNSGRWMQWQNKAVNAPGDARSDLWIINQLMKRIQELYAADGGPGASAITDLTWDYGNDPDAHDVAKEINGYDLTSNQVISGFDRLKNDGTTSSGNWLYSGSYTEEGNMAARRDKDPGGFGINLYPRWGWCWPDNRRIMYNRASVDSYGQPWDEERAVIQWNPILKQWKGDVPDGDWPPMAVDPAGSKHPFIMLPDGHGHIFGPGLADGPFPEHYEPWESPVENPFSGTQNNPALKVWQGPMDLKGTVVEYPIVCTTFRVGEHWQSGQTTRNLPWMVEMMPEMYVEISEELAAEKGISSSNSVTVKSARGQVTAKALVTKRLKPLRLNGQTVHEIALPWHWGFMGLSSGDSANVLSPNVGDANCAIPEYKAFLINLERAA
jgi:formate dehydrogenase major subunit